MTQRRSAHDVVSNGIDYLVIDGDIDAIVAGIEICRWHSPEHAIRARFELHILVTDRDNFSILVPRPVDRMAASVLRQWLPFDVSNDNQRIALFDFLLWGLVKGITTASARDHAIIKHHLVHADS